LLPSLLLFLFFLLIPPPPISPLFPYTTLFRSLSLPAMFSLVASSLVREKHTMGIGIQSLTKRLPIIIGPIVGGLLMDRYGIVTRSEEHTSELQSRGHLVCRLLLEKKKKK